MIIKKLKTVLCNRGPDLHGSHLCSNDLYFGGFVLWQQGEEPGRQPAVGDNCVLILNGDIFNKPANVVKSDTLWLLDTFDSCETDIDILEVFRTIKGPYSLVLYKKTLNAIYVVRDSLGRNSLLVEKTNEDIRLLSTSCKTARISTTIEFPPFGVLKICKDDPKEIKLYPWQMKRFGDNEFLKAMENILETEITFGECINPDWLHPIRNHTPAYDFAKLSANEKTEELYSKLLKFSDVSETVRNVIDLIDASVKERVCNTPKFCARCLFLILKCNDTVDTCNHAKVGLLFSGGIDCTILAIIMDRYVNRKDPIDLINVAFQKYSDYISDSSIMDWNVPDRVSAEESHSELVRLLPHRQWNLVKVNVTRQELDTELSMRIKHLIYPLNTVLDQSLGCAFWFAARGIGHVNGKIYNTSARVLLLGSGADELFGGYIRHRNAYNRCKGDDNEKLKSLQAELDMDWERIPMRNLGRDDRVIADHGKTARAPFIEENLVKFIRNLHPLQICCFHLNEGIGDKLLLRLCGYQLGLNNVVHFKKRAIQFGSRIANKNQNAKDISTQLVS